MGIVIFNKMCNSKLSHYNPIKMEELEKQFDENPQNMLLYDLLARVLKLNADAILRNFISDMNEQKVPLVEIEGDITELAGYWLETKEELDLALAEMADGHDDTGLEVLVLAHMMMERLERLQNPSPKSKLSLVVDNSKNKEE